MFTVILSNIDQGVIRILVITLLRYKSAFVSLYFRNVFVSACNNIAETCLESFIYPTSRNLFYSRTCLRSDDLYASSRATYRARHKSPWKCPCLRFCSSAKHKLSVAAWQTVWNRDNETIPEKRNRYSPVGRVAKKNIAPCRALWNIYPGTLRQTCARRFRKFSTHKRTQRVRACRRFNRSPLDEPAVHIKQESQSPEGGKHTRLIKRELPDGPMEQETEEDQADEREYSESHGHDSGQDEDIAEDLSMAPDIMIPEDQVEA